jgi:primosomal protein N''
MRNPQKRTLHIETLSNVDHRTLFSIEEVQAAYALEFTLDEARSMALAIMDVESCPIIPGKPAFFAEHLLGLLSRLSPELADRVRAAGG